MTNKEKLLQYIENLTPEQAETIVARLDLIKQALAMTEAQAIYTQTLTGKLFNL